MLSLQTLNNIEALLMSRSHPAWGEFTALAQVIGEVQAAKQELTQLRPQPTAPIITGNQSFPSPGPKEPATPPGYKEVG